MSPPDLLCWLTVIWSGAPTCFLGGCVHRGTQQVRACHPSELLCWLTVIWSGAPNASLGDVCTWGTQQVRGVSPDLLYRLTVIWSGAPNVSLGYVSTEQSFELGSIKEATIFINQEYDNRKLPKTVERSERSI
jgi:hypothetical protein